MPFSDKTFKFLPGDPSTRPPGAGDYYALPGVYTEVDLEIGAITGGARVENIDVFFGGRPIGAPIKDILKTRVIRADAATVTSGIEYGLVQEIIRQAEFRENHPLVGVVLGGPGSTYWSPEPILDSIKTLIGSGSTDGIRDDRFSSVAFRVRPGLSVRDDVTNQPVDALVQYVTLHFFTPEPETILANLVLPQVKARRRGLFVPGAKRTRSNRSNFVNQRVPHR